MTNMRPPQRSVLLKVVILGDGGVGKSCLMNRFVSNRYEENNFHTIGVEFMNKDIVVDNETYTLQIWDTAGQERFRALRTPFYRGSDICILCYDLCDRDSLRGLRQWRDEFINYSDVKLNKFPFIIVGNKNDLPPRQRQVSNDEVQQWCTDNQISTHIETSSKTACNVSDAFTLAVRQWKQLECLAEAELRQNGDTIDLTRPIRLMHKQFCCTGGGGGGGNNNEGNVDDDAMRTTTTTGTTSSSSTARQLLSFGKQRKASERL